MKKCLTVLITFIPFLYPNSVYAHSFGRLYNLPVPFWMYLYGGVAAIVASFLVIGFFFNKTKVNDTHPTTNLSQLRLFRLVTSPAFITTLKIVSVFLFLLTIIAGFVGTNLPTSNINMTLFWIFFALGLTYLTAFIGNIYACINPFKVIAELGERIASKPMKGILPYPKGLNYYPALVFYILFIGIELFANTTPFALSIILLQYTFFTVFGIILFGRDVWFRYAEFFSVFFRLIGKMAPVEYKKGDLFLRPPFVGLLKETAGHFSLLLFILFMLSSTAFDGFRETVPFYRFYWQNLDSVFRPILGGVSYEAYQILVLLLSPFVFLALYLLLVGLAKVMTKSKQSLGVLSLRFAFSLIPIAFVYNIAHYYTLVITEGSNLGKLISDPFGRNWNLLGTDNWPNIPTVDMNFVWHSQVAFILLGHIIGVYLAHIIALKVFPGHKKALVSQFPMLILMICYTVAGLWILSQPISSGI